MKALYIIGSTALPNYKIYAFICNLFIFSSVISTYL